jgi:putative transposase
MPRKPRFFVPGLPVHVVQRGNNRQAIFFEEIDYQLYLSLLNEARSRYGCEIHAYVLMTNHVHILATPLEKVSVSRMMQYVGRHYVPYINQKYRRSGTLWEGRFKAALVETSEYLLACYRYVELNPVRAGIVRHPGEYRWSSYGRNGLQLEDGLVTTHTEYQELGTSDQERAKNYRMLFEGALPESSLKSFREYTQFGTPLGNSKFREEIEAALEMKTGQPLRGRLGVGLGVKIESTSNGL